MRRFATGAAASAAAAVLLAVAACSDSDPEGTGGGDSATFGFSGWSVGYLPTAIAVDRLAEQGYQIEPVELGGNPNQLQAAAQGEVDITAIAQLMDAIDQGVDLRFFLGGNSNEFIMVSRAEYPDCASLAGRTVGIHSESSFVGQLAIQWQASECPDAEHVFTVVEGSENRLAALLQGQLDASPIDLQDWTLLSAERPGEFVVTQDFTRSHPIMRAVFGASPQWLAGHEQLATAWIETHLAVYQEIYDDPAILVAKATELLPEIDQAVLPDIVDAFVQARVWPVDGGLQDADVQATIDFFNADGEAYQTISGPADVVDRAYLDAVLAEQG
jgi:ABC-type nitrate/sulfonate/bicarbonate transport system substrate-binding protein